MQFSNYAWVIKLDVFIQDQISYKKTERRNRYANETKKTKTGMTSETSVGNFLFSNNRAIFLLLEKAGGVSDS